MIAICGAFSSGKTRKLVEIAAQRNATLVVRNREEVISAAKLAKDMGVRIQLPITYEIFRSRGLASSGFLWRKTGYSEFLIDDLDIFLNETFPEARIIGFSVSIEEIPTLRHDGQLPLFEGDF